MNIRDFYKKLFLSHHTNVGWEKGVIVEGDTSLISLGEGTVIEPGAVLSTKHGGSISLGRECVVSRGAMIMTYGGDITIGDNSGVGPYTILYGHGGLKIGNYVRFAAHSVVIPANHRFDALDQPIYKQPLSKKGIIIGNDVWVGANVCVLDGVRIGDGVVIGAGSVVTKDITPFNIVSGNSAHTVKSRKDG